MQLPVARLLLLRLLVEEPHENSTLRNELLLACVFMWTTSLKGQQFRLVIIIATSLLS